MLDLISSQCVTKFGEGEGIKATMSFSTMEWVISLLYFELGWDFMALWDTKEVQLDLRTTKKKTNKFFLSATLLNQILSETFYLTNFWNLLNSIEIFLTMRFCLSAIHVVAIPTLTLDPLVSMQLQLKWSSIHENFANY